MILAAGADASAGPLGLIIVLLLGVATVLLVRNMNGRLKRLPPSFDPPPVDPTAPGAENRPVGDPVDDKDPDSLTG